MAASPTCNKGIVCFLRVLALQFQHFLLSLFIVGALHILCRRSLEGPSYAASSVFGRTDRSKVATLSSLCVPFSAPLFPTSVGSCWVMRLWLWS